LQEKPGQKISLNTLEKYIAKEYRHTDVQGVLLNPDALINPDLQFEEIMITINGQFAFVTAAILLLL
jgi:hypothetical protein